MNMQQCQRCGRGPIVNVATVVPYKHNVKHSRSELLLECKECGQPHYYILDNKDYPPIKIVKISDQKAAMIKEKYLEKCKSIK